MESETRHNTNDSEIPEKCWYLTLIQRKYQMLMCVVIRWVYLQLKSCQIHVSGNFRLTFGSSSLCSLTFMFDCKPVLSPSGNSSPFFVSGFDSIKCINVAKSYIFLVLLMHHISRVMKQHGPKLPQMAKKITCKQIANRLTEVRK